MSRKACAFVLVVLALSLAAVPGVHAENPISNFRVVQGLPDKIVAGSRYEVVFSFDSIAPESVPFALSMKTTCKEAPLGLGETILEGVCLNGVYLTYVEAEPGFFTSGEVWTLKPQSSNVLSVFLSSVANLMPGTYTFEFDYGSGSFVISSPPMPPNKRPVAEAGPDQTVYVGNVTCFSGVGSYDPDGTVVSYLWYFGDGVIATGMNVSHIYSEPGTYTVTLTVMDDRGASGDDICTVKVLGVPPLKSAKFVVSDLSITPSEVEPGEEVTISVLATNVGEEPGSHTVTLHMENGLVSIVEVEEVTLEGGKSERVEFVVLPDVEGTYSVDVDGLTGSFRVSAPSPKIIIPIPKPAEFVVSDLKITPSEVKEGEEVTVTVTVTNIGEATGTYTVQLKIDGVVKQTAETTLDGGASKAVTFKVRESVGKHEVTVDGLTGSFTVTAPPTAPIWLSPGYIAGILILIAAAATSVYALYRRGRLRPVTNKE